MDGESIAARRGGGDCANRQRLLFIGGLGRSGSTLIEKLLNELTPTFSVGETVHLWERGVRDNQRCGCGERFSACGHWKAVGQEAFGGWEQIDPERLTHLRWSVDRSRRLPHIFGALKTGRTTSAQREYLDAMRSVLVAAAVTEGSRVGVDRTEIVLLDSSKHLSTAALLACDPALDVRVLHLIRDPRGVAHSWMKTVDRPETDGEIMPKYSPRRTALRWVTDNLGFETLRKLGVPVLTMRYEDILERPTERIVEIARFSGAMPTADEIGGDDVTLPFLVGRAAHLTTPMHSVAGNPLRFGGDNLTLRLDDAWREEMKSKDRRTVERVVGPVLARYGYRRG